VAARAVQATAGTCHIRRDLGSVNSGDIRRNRRLSATWCPHGVWLSNDAARSIRWLGQFYGLAGRRLS
jgi:hypothetical protein